jgi:hypothetical protein
LPQRLSPNGRFPRVMMQDLRTPFIAGRNLMPILLTHAGP